MVTALEEVVRVEFSQLYLLYVVMKKMDVNMPSLQISHMLGQ